MVVTLYYHPISQPSRAVYVLARIADLKFNKKIINVFEGEHKTPEYIKICPLKQIPAIDYDGYKMAESAAIMKYIALKNRSKIGKRWLGNDNPEYEANVEQFVGWHQSGLRKHCIGVFIPSMRNTMDLGPFKKQAMDGTAVNEAKEAVKEAVKIVADYFLKDKKFIGGPDISIADLLCYCELQQLDACGEENLYMTNPKIQKWIESVEDRIKKPMDEASVEIKKMGQAFLAAKKSQAKLILYFHPLSQPSRAVYLFLKCADVKFETKVIDVFAGENKTPEYVKICPLKQIPAITYDDTKMAESAAIMKYIGLMDPGKVGNHWFGKDSAESEANVDQFIGWHQSGIRKHCIDVFIPTARNVMDLGPYKKQAMDVKAVNEAKEKVKEAVKIIADHFLKDKKFIGGANISIADLLGFCELQQLNACGEDNLYLSNSKVKEWMKRVGDRIKKPLDEVSVALKKMGQAFAPAKK